MVTSKFFIPFFFVSLLVVHIFAIDSVQVQPIKPITTISPINDSISQDTRPGSDPFITHILDSSIPAPTRFYWNTTDSSKLMYDFLLSEDTTFTTNTVLISGISDTQCAVWNLKINTKYFWTVLSKDSTTIIASSTIASFKTPDLWPRMLYIDGTKNVRDIGGMTTPEGKLVRQGLLFRGSELNETYTVTPKGLDQLYQLGIVCEIDLRLSQENPRIVMPWLLRYIRPVDEDGIGLESYSFGLKNTTVQIRAVFKEMAIAQNYPIYLHCRIGADRTGTIAALLEAILGCSEQQMGTDYIWTSLSLSLNGIRDTAYANWKNMMIYLKSFDTETSTIQRGCWNYLQSIGVSVKELIAIRKIFINDDSQPYPALSTNGNRPDSKRNALVPVRSYINVPGSFDFYSRQTMITPYIFDLSGKRIHFTALHGNSQRTTSGRPSASGLYIVKGVRSKE